MKNHLLYKASQPSNPVRTPGGGGERELLELGRWGYMVWLFAATAPGEVAVEGVEEGSRMTTVTTRPRVFNLPKEEMEKVGETCHSLVELQVKHSLFPRIFRFTFLKYFSHSN